MSNAHETPLKVQVKPTPPTPTEDTSWKNPKWWTALVSQLISMATILGVFTSEQSKSLDNASSTIISATAIVIANLTFIYFVIKQSRSTEVAKKE